MRGGATRRSLCLLAATGVAAVAAAAGTAAEPRASSALDGRWLQTATVTAAELISRGVPPELARTGPMLRKPALDFQAGRFRVFDLANGKTVGAGAYQVHGGSVRVVFTSAPSVESIVGRVNWIDWNVYRDRLAFSQTPGREVDVLLPWLIHPWTRVHR
jgi:hypothetical protein